MLLAALLAAHALGVLPLAPLTRLDHALYDLQVRWFAPPGIDPVVAMVEIDERSLARFGRWPWRRARLAELIERCFADGGARLVGLDIELADAEHDAGLAALDALQRGPLGQTAAGREAIAAARAPLDDDARLAEVLARRPVVLAFHLSDEPAARPAGGTAVEPGAVPPPPLLPAEALGAHADALPDWPGRGGNVARLQQAARRGAGHLNGLLDDDGVLRRMPLLLRHGGQVHGALPLVMARWWLGSDDAPATLGLLPSEPPLRALRLAGPGGALRVAVDAQGIALVPYRPGTANFLRVSAADVVDGRIPADALRGKAVLIGVGAPGLIDQRHTPVSGALPGTLLHANMLAGMLDDRVIAEPRHAGWLGGALVLALALALALALPRMAVGGAALLAMGLVLAVVAGDALAWATLHRTLPIGAPVLLPPLLLALHLALGFRRAARARQRLKALFGQYVPPELVDEMSRQPEAHTMNSRSAELSVLFADVRGFTGLAERMPPAELSAMMNLLFSRLTDIVRAHRGTLDKYIGDCVMAFWGAPLDDAEHARHAVAAALAMRAALPALQDELAAHGWPRLDLTIGIDSGVVVVGDMGSRHRLAYTVLGDAVNRAARLQALAGEDGVGLLIGEATQRGLAGDGGIDCLPLGEVQLRGRDAPTPVWLPLPLAADAAAAAGQRRRVRAWHALQRARRRRHDGLAQRLLAGLEAARPGDPACAWLRRHWR